ncbi:MAG TPA: hypothetical protein VK826_09365 [Bacteroidia bacterium]|nr:hypothetical protein [Bacteroidia bacterium]
MRWILKCIGAVILFTVLAFALAWVTMLLWNWLVPGIFGGPMITYVEAAGLMILGRLLFGGFKSGKSCCHHGGGWHHGKHGYWKKRWESKMAGMSPEEREKFRSGMNKCGWKYEEEEPKQEQNAGGNAGERLGQ